jgi:cellulose synthase operon protein C
VLEGLAEADPQRWLGAFTEAAERSEKRAQLEALWKRLGDAPSTPATLRSQIAFRLLEAGDKTSAERVFRSLAASAGPDDPVTRQLLFVWGPRPLPAQLDWLESRAKVASATNKAIWLRLLAERGGSARVLHLWQTSERVDDDEAVAAAYLDAVAALGDRATMRTLLKERLARTRSPTELVRLAQHASTLADAILHRQLIEAAIAAGSTDFTLQHTLGLLAYREHDWVTAERWLNSYHLARAGNYETHRLVGETRLQRRDPTGARRSFEKALELLEQSSQRDYAELVTRAALLQRLGRADDARAQYENLLARRPSDDDLRADFASMLMSQGDSKSAQAILDERVR